MNISNYSACLFDFDFTLCDASSGIIKTYNDSFESFGLPRLEDDVIRATIGLHVKESFTIMTGISDEKLQNDFYDTFVSVADGCMTSMTEFLPGARELLEALYEAKIPAGVVTTKLAYRVRDFFESAGCSELLSVVIGAESVKNCKPDPEGLFKASSVLGIAPSKCLYCGDSYVDAVAAQKFGCDFIAVTTGTTAADEFKKHPHKAILSGVGELTV